MLEPSATRLEVLADPTGACAGLLIATAASGGELVLAGGRPPGVPRTRLVADRAGVVADRAGVAVHAGTLRGRP
jgi:hypothetical protein